MATSLAAVSRGLVVARTLVFLLLVGCGGGGSSSGGSNPQPPAPPPVPPAPAPTGGFTPDDPLFAQQFHLENTSHAGEDTNVLAAWAADYVGGGVLIAIVDDGMELAHADLAPNVLVGASWDYVNFDIDPSPDLADQEHGTAVAGVAAARGGNSEGVTGAAPFASICAFNVIGTAAATDLNIADALSRNAATTDIYNMSFGVSREGHYVPASTAIRSAIASGIDNGRDGKGSIYVKAAGNGRAWAGRPNLILDDANFDSEGGLHGVINVGAVNDEGRYAAYSVRGSSVLVCAPSSDTRGGHDAVVTTDRSGTPGYANGDYTGSFGGTSSACPVVSGVVALMLQANPALTWRDVKHVLVRSARRNDPGDGDWSQNGAGLWVNHNYGFGVVDAGAATLLAATWTTLGTRYGGSATGSASPNTQIPDNNAVGISSSVQIANPSIATADYVKVTINLPDHTYYTDLEIVLTSPDGTSSVLKASNSPATAPPVGVTMELVSHRHLGESVAGTWTLTVRDLEAQDTGAFASWSLEVWGD